MSDLVERLARAMWEDWRANGKTASENARDLSWEQIVEGGKTRPLIQAIVDDAYSQARAVLSELEASGMVVVPREPTDEQLGIHPAMDSEAARKYRAETFALIQRLTASKGK